MSNQRGHPTSCCSGPRDLEPQNVQYKVPELSAISHAKMQYRVQSTSARCNAGHVSYSFNDPAEAQQRPHHFQSFLPILPIMPAPCPLFLSSMSSDTAQLQLLFPTSFERFSRSRRECQVLCPTTGLLSPCGICCSTLP